MTEIARSIHTELEEERKAAQPDAAMVRTFRSYARGRQRGTLNAAQQRILRGLLGNLFADNVCAMVLGQLSARLQLVRYAVEGSEAQATAAQAVETFLRGVWTFNLLPALSGAVHWATVRDGNHAIALAWDDGRVRLARENWWNGERGLWVAYDEAERPKYAVKEWKTTNGKRRTIWYPERIERYRADGSGWRMINLPSDLAVTGVDIEAVAAGQGRPVPWVDAGGQPLGIPVVHFACRERPTDGDGDGDPSPLYGASVLDGGVLGLQDEINDVQRDISAGDYSERGRQRQAAATHRRARRLLYRRGPNGEVRHAAGGQPPGAGAHAEYQAPGGEQTDRRAPTPHRRRLALW
jgi:hypothetical protein